MISSIAAALRSLIPHLAQIVCEAGSAILEVYNTDFDVDLKEDASPLTLADRRSHNIILEKLKSLISPPLLSNPIHVLSEEGRDIPYRERVRWQYFWMVDPLDGTKEFVKRNGEFTINVALIERDRPLLGVVYIPVSDVMYCGYSGEYAYRFASTRSLVVQQLAAFERGERLPLRSAIPAEPGVIRVAGSRSHSGKAFDDYLEERKKEYREVRVLYSGSALKFCVVAEGSADVYPRFGPTMEWDTAAGHAVARGAGKNVILCGSDQELRYNKKNLRNGPFICR
jgi:3'(2'), 5'-bisphosphate nucleotidase